MSLRAKACCNVPRVAFSPLALRVWRAMARLRHRARRRGPHRAKKRGVASDGNEAERRRAKSFVSRVCLSASIRDRSKMSSISASSAFRRRVRFETTYRLCRGCAHRLRFAGQTVVWWTHLLRDRQPMKPFYTGGLHLISSSISIYLPPTFLSNTRVSRISNSITTSAKKASEALI